MKVKMKSGEKELVLNHKIIYAMGQETERDILEWLRDMDMLKVNATYTLLYYSLKSYYENIDEMLDDLLDGVIRDYAEAVGEEVKKLFGVSTEEE